MIFYEYFLQTAVDPNAPLTIPAAPAEKKKGWNLNRGPLFWMDDCGDMLSLRSPGQCAKGWNRGIH